MKNIFRFTGFILLGLVLGALFAFYKIKQTHSVMQQNGSWRFTLEAGATNESLMNRAVVARNGLYALQKSEVLYYFAHQDSAGQPLDSQYVYEVSGVSPKARYWSICLYGEDYFLVKNDQNRFSYNLQTAEPDSVGRFSFRVATQPQTGKWLPTGNAKKFMLCLRIYNGDSTVFNNPNTTPLPIITKQL